MLVIGKQGILKVQISNDLWPCIDALGLCALLDGPWSNGPMVQWCNGPMAYFLCICLQETAFNPGTAAVNDESVSTSLAAEEGTGDGGGRYFFCKDLV